MRTFIVAAFSSVPFRGNPAGVCILESAIGADVMQKLAAELRQPETAFLSRSTQGWTIRWFSPTTEVALCGHATLAAAKVLWDEAGVPDASIRFTAGDEVLLACRDDERIWLDFPTIPGIPCETPSSVADCIDVPWTASSRHGDRWLLECADAATVRCARPDFAGLVRANVRSLILTAKSDMPGYDIVSRNFAPIVGVNEDQVTGSAHACLAPYWQDRLGTELSCWQASARGGAIKTRLVGSRVSLGGSAVIEFRGGFSII